MKFLLILTFMAPDHAPSQLAIGVMIDEQTCIVAGAGSKHILEAANPGLDVTWTCVPVGDAGV